MFCNKGDTMSGSLRCKRRFTFFYVFDVLLPGMMAIQRCLHHLVWSLFPYNPPACSDRLEQVDPSSSVVWCLLVVGVAFFIRFGCGGFNAFRAFLKTLCVAHPKGTWQNYRSFFGVGAAYFPKQALLRSRPVLIPSLVQALLLSTDLGYFCNWSLSKHVLTIVS